MSGKKIFTIYIRKLRFEEARRKFLREIEQAFLAGESEVEVIHGIGTYTLRRMVEDEAGRLDYVYVQDTTGHLNPGSVRLTLLSPGQDMLNKYLVRE